MGLPLTAPFDPVQASASAIIAAQLADWGLPTLAGQVNDLIRQGYGQDAITLQLEQTPEYKQRFAGNEARQKAGLPMLSPADYVSTERAYKQVLSQYGIPAGFYDDAASMAKLISHDISPDELKTRAQDAQSVWLSKDTSTQSAFRSFYGLSDGAAIASILDPEKALPILQRMTTAAQIGGAALNNGMGITQADASRFEQYADQGVTQQQAQKGFAQIGSTFAGDQQAAARAGLSYSQQDAEQAVILNQAGALAKQQQVYDTEKSLFAGRGSSDQNTLSSRNNGTY